MRIDHKNLVKLLGCSIEGPESLLVYEYLPNKSLDQFIFDKNKTKLLNWKQRFNVISGTAEGLAYLHDVATWLLSTFVHRQLTEKADVYSFGKMVLETICGTRNHAFTQDSASPLQTVWMLNRSNKLFEPVYPSLKDDFPAKEACSVLQIGLLCTQVFAALRLSMAQVVPMLSEKNCEIPIPNPPPFLNASVLQPGNSSRSYSTNSFISNAATKINVSYTSSQSSSTHSWDGHSRSTELTQKQIHTKKFL